MKSFFARLFKRKPKPRTATYTVTVPQPYRRQFCRLWDELQKTPSTENKLVFWEFAESVTRDTVDTFKESNPWWHFLDLKVSFNGSVPEIEFTLLEKFEDSE